MFQNHRFSFIKVICFLTILAIGGYASYLAFYSNILEDWKRLLVAGLIAAVGVLFATLYWKWQIQPSNDRNWRPENSKLATMVEGSDNEIEIRNLRNFRYSGKDISEANYETRRYDLDKVSSVDFVISYWGHGKGKEKVAHTLLSFGFEGGEYLSVSIEVRGEIGEKFNPLAGLVRRYELIYIVGDERDIIGSRIQRRGEVVYLYPSKATPQQARDLLIDMLRRANAIAKKPVFYNTLLQNCTTSLIGHLNSVLTTRVPLSRGIVLNGLSDRFAYQMGYLKTDLPFEVLKEACLIDADIIGENDNFSEIIRERRDDTLKMLKPS